MIHIIIIWIMLIKLTIYTHFMDKIGKYYSNICLIWCLSIFICSHYIMILSWINYVLPIKNNLVFSFTKLYFNLQISIAQVQNAVIVNIFFRQILQNQRIPPYFETFSKNVTVVRWKSGKFWVKYAEIQPPVDPVARNMVALPVMHHYVGKEIFLMYSTGK